MRIVAPDIEGVAGVVTFKQDSYSTGKYYEDAKRLLTAEVNAAVEGLLAADVEEAAVVVVVVQVVVDSDVKPISPKRL